jgi:hypothetical protein
MANERDIFSESFTGKYAPLADVVRDGRSRLNAIDKELASLPKSPQPTPTPFGTGDNYSADETKRRLLSQKTDIQMNIRDRVIETTKDDGVQKQSLYLEKAAYLSDPKNTEVDKTPRDFKTQEEASNIMAMKLQNNKDAEEMRNAPRMQNAPIIEGSIIPPSTPNPKTEASSPKPVDKQTPDKEPTPEQGKESIQPEKTNKEQLDKESELKGDSKSGADRFDAMLSSSRNSNSEDKAKSPDKEDKKERDSTQQDKEAKAETVKAPESVEQPKAPEQDGRTAADRYNETLSSSRGQKDGDMDKSFDTVDKEQPDTKEMQDMSGADRFDSMLSSSFAKNEQDIVMDSRSEPSDSLE